MVSRRLAITGAAAACAACCTPLVVPLVWPALLAAGVVGAGGAGGGWLAGLSPDVILCGAIALTALAGGGVWLRRKTLQNKAGTADIVEGASCDLQGCGRNKVGDRIA